MLDTDTVWETSGWREAQQKDILGGDGDSRLGDWQARKHTEF